MTERHAARRPCRSAVTALMAVLLWTVSGSAEAATRTVTVNAEADSMVKRASAGSAFGAANPLQADQSDSSGNPVHAYLRFSVPGLAAGESVTGARLGVVVRNATTNGPSIWRTATTWSESGMTWNTGRPARSGTAAVGSFGSLGTLARAGTAVSGSIVPGPVSFELAPDSTDGLDFASRESANAADRPQLVLTVTSASDPPPDPAAEDPFAVSVRRVQAFARNRLAATTTRLSSTAWPHLTGTDLRWRTTGASAWTSGFLPGSLWLAYQESADTAWRSRAQSWQSGLAGQASDTSTHDVGFKVHDSFGNGYRLTGNDTYRQTALKAAGSLATRYSSVVGATRSWNSASSEFRVIVDNLMNLELLLWASRNGGQQSWRDIAVSHALVTARDHVRPDGSTYHLVIYDPATGAVKSRTTHQGYSAGSTWSRGQAWAMHGFTMVYGETRDARFLDAARRVSDWFLDHLPADHVPYWDFSAPGIPGAPRDTSAAAIAASGLLELSELDSDATRAQRYATAARSILTSLMSGAYLSEGTGSEAILLHGTSNWPAGSSDTGLIYGDYYLQEALLRLRRQPAAGTPLPVTAVTASGSDANVATNAVDGDLATRWSASGDGQWLQLDLGQARTVTKISVAFYQGATRAARFDLQASPDGATWTTLTRAVSSATTLKPETYDVRDTTARYVRLVGHGATGTTWSSVTEIAVR